MRNICIIQPLLAAYRLDVFEEIAEKANLSLIISESDYEAGYGKLTLPRKSNINFKLVKIFKPFGDVFGMYQKGIISYLFVNRPDTVMIFSNPRYLSFWTTLIFCRLFGIKVFPHGHGIFKKNKVSFVIKVMYKLIFVFATRYICYCDYVAKSFIKLDIDPKKIAVVENSLINRSSNPDRHLTNLKNSILFIGRIREGCNIGLLIEVVKELRLLLDTNFKIEIIGGGPKLSELELEVENISWVTLHGEIYNQTEIKKIAENSDIGVYPGDAGLSVVHYMSLGLPSVVHNDYKYHFGPEPTYIKNGVNGVTFSRDSKESLKNEILKLYEAPKLIKEMQSASFKSYVNLIKPSQAERFLEVFKAD